MKNYLALSLLLSPLLLFSQSKLNFQKRFIQAENKWVALLADTSGSHAYGFVYTDPTAGLTLDFQGYFKVNADNTYTVKKKENDSQMKYRIQPNNTLVAIIPENKFTELGVSKVPDWLKFYQTDTVSSSHFYKKGYNYNAWNECETALIFLKKAYQKEPNYKGLRTEMAFSYNCLERYQEAITILQQAIKDNPVDAYAIKELIFSQVKNGAVDEALSTYKEFAKKNLNNPYQNENAYNILHGYFTKKDIENFNKWLTETQIANDKQFAPHIIKMKKDLKL